MRAFVLNRFSLPAAVMAAAFFVLALLVAVLVVPEYQPAQHPPALLGSLPGGAGVGFRWMLFIVPGLLLGASALCLPGTLLASRAGRIGQHLAVIAALGFMLMGVLGVGLEGSLESAMRGQALAWLLWLAAAVAACLAVATGLASQGQRRPAALSLLAGVLLAGLSLLPVPGLAAPLAQPLAWLLWMGWAAGLARLGAPLRSGSTGGPG